LRIPSLTKKRLRLIPHPPVPANESRGGNPFADEEAIETVHTAVEKRLMFSLSGNPFADEEAIETSGDPDSRGRRE